MVSNKAGKTPIIIYKAFCLTQLLLYQLNMSSVIDPSKFKCWKPVRQVVYIIAIMVFPFPLKDSTMS